MFSEFLAHYIEQGAEKVTGGSFIFVAPQTEQP